MPAAPLLVFDLDGTLADTAGDLVASLNHILAREGLKDISYQAAREMVGTGARSLISQGYKVNGRELPPDRLENLFVDYLAHYEANIAVHTKLFPGVEASLDRFEAEGWRFAVCTNKIEAPSIKLLTALGIAGRFRAICGQDTFAWCKPDARALLATIEKAGGAPGATIMVGDSHTDISTAKNASIQVVAVDFGYTDVPVTQLAPDVVISHFDALWDAVAGLRGA